MRGGGGMKKRLAAAVLAVLLVLPVLSSSTLAADPVYFTAVNETVLELTATTMPFWSGGYLYVSCTMFSNKELGVFYSLNYVKQTMVLYTNRSALIFNLQDGSVADTQGNSYYPGTIVRGNDIFLPISMVSNYFGLVYTNMKVSQGYLIRVKSSNAVLSDSMFLDAVPSQLEYRYSQYLKSLTPAGEPTQPQQPEEQLPVVGKSIYLCVLANDIDRTEALLDVLDRHDCQATFYLSPKLLPQAGDLLRRMAATGQGIGLAPDASAPADRLASDLNRENDRLFEACRIKTRLTALPGGSQQQLSTLEDAGFRCLAPTLDRSAAGLRTSSGAAALLKKITAKSGEVSVWLSDQVSPAGLQAFLTDALTANNRCLSMTETTG